MKEALRRLHTRYSPYRELRVDARLNVQRAGRLSSGTSRYHLARPNAGINLES